MNIALVQGGSVGQAAGELESLGTLFYEPLWIFHRGGLEGETTGRPARPEGLDRTGRQRLACASAQAAQAQ